MAEILHVIESNLHPDQSIKDCWTVMATNLRKVDADEEMISSMEKAFYMGAAQTFMSINQAAKAGTSELADVMLRIFDEVDAHIRHTARVFKTEGSA
jgi:hypothetical protein